MALSQSPPASPGPSPQLARRDKLVTAFYRHFLRRTAKPEPRELANWHTHLTERQIAQDILRSGERQAILYREACPTYLGRARPEGEAAWLAGAASRKGAMNDVRQHLVSLDEFWKSCGATRRGAIEKLHRIQLGRAPTAQELAGWDFACDRGLTVPRLADLLASSPEGRVVRAHAVYREAFGIAAPPQAAEWIAAQLAIGPEEDVLVTILTGQPYVGLALAAP